MSISDATRNRSIDLAGQIKQARVMIAECEGACKRSILAANADEESLLRAEERLRILIEERATLASQAHADVMAAGEEAGATVSQIESVGVRGFVDGKLTEIHFGPQPPNFDQFGQPAPTQF